MIKVYAVALALGFIGLLVVILGGALADNLDRPERDPGERFGSVGKIVLGAVAGFGMGGMSAEFSPLDLGWGVSLLIALGAAAIGMLWVRFATGQSPSR